MSLQEVLDSLQSIEGRLTAIETSRITEQRADNSSRDSRADNPSRLGATHAAPEVANVEQATAPINTHQREPGAQQPARSRLDQLASVDIQADFDTIKESLQRVRLDNGCRLNESKTGIGRSEQPLLTVVSKSARYIETSIKYLSIISGPEQVTEDNLEELFRIQLAHLRYLQDEYSGLLVQSQFDQRTAKLFKSMQRNTAGLSGQALETLRSAAAISAAAGPAQQQHDQAGRGRGRFQRGGGPPRFRSDWGGAGGQRDWGRGNRDPFHQQTQRANFQRRGDGANTNNSTD